MIQTLQTLSETLRHLRAVGIAVIIAGLVVTSGDFVYASEIDSLLGPATQKTTKKKKAGSKKKTGKSKNTSTSSREQFYYTRRLKELKVSPVGASYPVVGALAPSGLSDDQNYIDRAGIKQIEESIKMVDVPAGCLRY